MITLRASNLPLSEIREAIENKIQHSYLEKYIQKPVIDDDKLCILSSIIKNTPYSDTKKKNYIITVMLVQIALDTHDLVSKQEEKDEPDRTKKQRQLTVLAGDYYSGLYYYFLSQLDDISMIHTLASAIKEINELKMTVYYKEFESVQEFMDDLMLIESLLIRRVAEFFERSFVNEFTSNWLLTRKLMREKHNYLKQEHSPIFELLTNGPAQNIHYNQIVGTVEQFIQRSVLRVEETVVQLPVHFQSLKTYVNKKIYESIGNNSKVLEEG
ncbi:heptaprenyl diphosphate synthase component 1 [Sediminibacillus albus]|uniref:Heptaprenyl diphosphate synthase n=1 Tax=Sediminibacillus albus TaxID=407036 RepID=A0A1G8VN85_9BACI|nr:heptaprenyl diphosphate synthase component 1 [Sediminibacillus albus]SDJ67367.1 heptaprenyl diphosphate synthase [Sediminibacillus albus]